MKLLCALLLCLSAHAEDYSIKVESSLFYTWAQPSIGFQFVGGKHWGSTAKILARRGMKGIPESDSGGIRLYRVYPRTAYTNQLLLYPKYKSLLSLIVNRMTGEVLGADFFINRRRSAVSDTRKLVLKMREQLNL